MQRPFYPPELDCEFGLKERGAFYGKKALGRKTGLVIWRTEHWLKDFESKCRVAKVVVGQKLAKMASLPQT